MDLLKEYGCCYLKSGKLLWTWQRAEWELRESEAFCFIDPGQVYHSRNHNHYQLSLTKDVKLICLFRIKPQGFFRAESTLQEVYELVMEEKYPFDDDVALKESRAKRASFIAKLRQAGIDGWLAPVEGVNMFHCEVCMFEGKQVLQKQPVSGENNLLLDEKLQVTHLGSKGIRKGNYSRQERARLRHFAIEELKESAELEGSWSPIDKYL